MTNLGELSAGELSGHVRTKGHPRGTQETLRFLAGITTNAAFFGIDQLTVAIHAAIASYSWNINQCEKNIQSYSSQQTQKILSSEGLRPPSSLQRG